MTDSVLEISRDEDLHRINASSILKAKGADDVEDKLHMAGNPFFSIRSRPLA